MKQILLVISPNRHSTEALHWSMHKAKETGRTVRIGYVINGSGDHTGSPLLEAVERQCRTFQAPFETVKREGDYLKICQELGAEADVDTLVFIEKGSSFLKKWFYEPEIKKILGNLSCEVKAYPADN